MKECNYYKWTDDIRRKKQITVNRNMTIAYLDATTTQEKISKDFGYKDDMTANKLFKEINRLFDNVSKNRIAHQIDPKRNRLMIDDQKYDRFERYVEDKLTEKEISFLKEALLILLTASKINFPYKITVKEDGIEKEVTGIC